MNKIVYAAIAALVGSGVFADDVEDLKKAAQEPVVQAEFEQPDGAAIKLRDDGSFQIFARGTGVYDLDDANDINKAQEESVFKAKAALAKFLNEKLAAEASLDEATKKTTVLTQDSTNQTASVSKEIVKQTAAKFKDQSEAILKGVVVLDTAKISRAGSSGEIQTTVGVSTKTLAAVSALVNGITPPPAVAPAPEPARRECVQKPVQKPVVRRAKGDF